MAKRHNGRLSTPIPIPTPTPTGSFCLVASFSPTPESVKRDAPVPRLAAAAGLARTYAGRARAPALRTPNTPNSHLLATTRLWPQTSSALQNHEKLAINQKTISAQSFTYGAALVDGLRVTVSEPVYPGDALLRLK